MASGRLYRCTEAGKAAWRRQDARVPVEYRRLLGLIESDTYLQAEMLALLDELVARGLLEALEAGEQKGAEQLSGNRLTAAAAARR